MTVRLLSAPLFGGLVVLGKKKFVEVSYVVVADGVSNFVDVFVGRSQQFFRDQ